MQSRSRFLLLLPLILAAASLAAQSRAESRFVTTRMIRSAYDKLARYNRASREHLAADADVADTLGLVFDIRAVEEGPLSDVASRPWRDFVTAPAGDIIRVSRSAMNIEGVDEVSYSAIWTTGPYVAEGTFSVADVLAMKPDRYADVERYAAYDVTVSLEGRTRSYRAMILFHGTAPEFFDDITGLAGELTNVYEDHRPALVGAGLRRLRLADYVEDESYDSFDWYAHGTVGHLNGEHSGSLNVRQACSIVGTTDQFCESAVYGKGPADDVGMLTLNAFTPPPVTGLWRHVGYMDGTGSQQRGPQGTPTSCDAVVIAAFQECLVDCHLSYSIGGTTPSGVSGSITVSGTNLPSSGYKFGRTCNIKDQYAYDGGCGGTLVVVDNLPDWDSRCDSPVLVDVEGDGFRLTDAAHGVAFDLDSDGTPDHLSWTAAGSDDAFLALDRNGNGVIDNGRELFGNFTPQPASATPNGFLALAEYDKTANGGNADGVVDAHDAIFASLLLWQDANHDGVSQPAELRPAASAGIVAIHDDYKESRRTDRYGNAFRYRARVDSRGHGELARWAWDVFFTRAH